MLKLHNMVVHQTYLQEPLTHLEVAASNAWSSRSLAMSRLWRWSSAVTTSVLSRHSSSSSSCCITSCCCDGRGPAKGKKKES
ncbi:hypothetical protein E2C01_035700 [Portunus trituberculatus]|uniref:Uncharacterized protein n=1 Tax=Portunus trituberculatus TaxID=210409 RepID=A0A5B7F923_PORTR|nr:hypothetical protein [Portunus trituberculatus]